MTKLTNVIYLDANTYKYWLTLLFSYFVGYHLFSSIVMIFVVQILLSLFLDYLYYFHNIRYYNSDLVIIRGYSVSTYMQDTLHSMGLDYGFNFYNGNYDKTREQAQIDKFKYAIKELGIKKGDSVIDIGCGCGDWLYYLKNIMKCKVVGINITQAQADECIKRNLDVIVTNWKDIDGNKDLKKLLYNKFDVVTFWDTVEHYVSMGEGLKNRPQRSIIYQNMFKLAHNLLNKESQTKRVWISCLHMRREVMGISWENIKKMWYVYLLDKFHSGFYPSYYEEKGIFHDELVDNAKKIGFELSSRKDVTSDYYMTSVLNPTHFGRSKFKMTPLRLFGMSFGFVVDPYWSQRLLWFISESWMDQFDIEHIDNSDVILFWLCFDVKK